MALAPYKALFLDFDGVLHPTGDGIEEVKHPFIWRPLLEGVLSGHSEVGIVVSSTWRYTHSDLELRQLLGSAKHHFLGAIPRGPRYDGIKWWLHMNRGFNTFRILDDHARDFPERPPELLLCDPLMGLTTPGVLDGLRGWLESA